MTPETTPTSQAQDSADEKPPGQGLGAFDRLKFALISTIAYWVARLICGTVHWRTEGREYEESLVSAGKPVIFTFWHGRILPATYYWRDRGIVVMTSQHEDGEYIARVIRRFGYDSARGSSSRGGRRALVEMLRHLRRNGSVAFTIDGPRGPRYVAKAGAVWLASKSGCPVFPFHISMEKKWVLRSWDLFQVPHPFTRALVLIGPPIDVSRDASEEQLAEAQRRLQQTLDSLLERGDSHWSGRTGS